MLSELSSRRWATILHPLLIDAWSEARTQILLASRLDTDSPALMITDPDHMGDPAQRVDLHMHQFLAAGLHKHYPAMNVYGEEATLGSVLMSRDFPYIAYLDAIDGSAQAWSLPGAWGNVVVIQEAVFPEPGTPQLELRFVAVVDAEGGTTTAEAADPFVTVRTLYQIEADTVDDDPLSYEPGEDLYQITGTPTVLVGGYKPTWWARFAELRRRIAEVWPAAPVFNTAGAPVARKVIQNSDNVAVQLTASTLWDGAAALLIARAGGVVWPVGAEQPLNRDEVWQMWSQFGYEPKPDDPGRHRPAAVIPPFVAGMRGDRVEAAIRVCSDLPPAVS